MCGGRHWECCRVEIEMNDDDDGPVLTGTHSPIHPTSFSQPSSPAGPTLRGRCSSNPIYLRTCCPQWADGCHPLPPLGSGSVPSTPLHGCPILPMANTASSLLLARAGRDGLDTGASNRGLPRIGGFFPAWYIRICMTPSARDSPLSFTGLAQLPSGLSLPTRQAPS